jgi:hypothetical protein
MKYALCLRGMHYFKSESYNTNFINFYKNYYDFIINPLINAGYEVHIFGFTYDTKCIELLKSKYNFKKLIIHPDSLRTLDNSTIRQINFHIESVLTIKEYEIENNIQYDFIINTRFDLIFNVKITEQNLNMFKINIAFKHLSGNCDDNYFIIPRFLLTDFNNACQYLLDNKKITHALNRCFKDEVISFMYVINNDDDKYKTEYKYFKFGRTQY